MTTNTGQLIVRAANKIFNYDMIQYSARVRTFLTWPKTSQQKPEDLASSGFYYLGNSDRVQCFYCGVGIHEWQPTDNVWMEHGKHSPNCAFMILHQHKSVVHRSENTLFDSMMVNVVHDFFSLKRAIRAINC